MTLPWERSIQNNRGPPGVSRDPCGGAQPWACLSGNKGGLRKQSVYDGGIWRVVVCFFLSACESRALTGNHSGGVCVRVSIIILSAQGPVSHTLEL